MRRILVMMFLLVTAPVGADDPVELLNQEERLWLESLGRPLIVGTDRDYRPYNFLDENGRLSGVAGDYVHLLEEKLQIQFDLKTYPSFAASLEGARNREFDLLPILIAAPERKSYLDFTQPVFETKDRIFVRQDGEAASNLRDLAGRRVGLVEGFALQATLERDYPQVEVVTFPNEVDGLLALSLGSVDAYVSEVGTASYYIQREAITNLRLVGEVVSFDPQTVGTRNDFPELGHIIGKGLAAISPEEHAEIQRRWINIGGVDPSELSQLWRRVAIALFVAFLALIAMSIWTMSLRRVVARRTGQLEKELVERKMVEAAKERLAVAVEQSAEFVVIVDTAGDIEYANLAFVEALGGQSLQGRAFDSVITWNSSNPLEDPFRAVRDRGNWTGRVSLAGDEQLAADVRLTISPIFDQGKLNGYVATGRDVTREEQLEAQLRQSEKLSALGTLAGGIAHDFNNLLVPILGYTDLIRRRSPESSATHLQAIAEASERARDLVERILMFGQGETGNPEPLDLRLEIEGSISFLRSVISKTIELKDDLRDVGAVMADRSQVQQILLNLCTNASDAMAVSGGTLSITLESRTVDQQTAHELDLRPGNYAVLKVSDTGVGMSDDIQARIFEPYFTQKQQAKGTGLGLATVHGIVSQCGGTIVVRSTPGEGSQFQVLLPTVDVRPSQPGQRIQDMPQGRGQMIMLIDDDELVLDALRVMLEGLGYAVSSWSSPTSALDAFRRDPQSVDLVLTDLSMPGVTGVQLAEEVHSIRAELPLAIMTGNKSQSHEYPARWIAKPMTLQSLAECVQEMLDGATLATASCPDDSEPPNP